jgi:aminoglycoside 6'-N-acetyltransferase I
MATVERITPDTLHLLERIAEDVFDDRIDFGHLTAMLATGTHILLVAVEDGCTVGQCLGMVHHGADRPPMLYLDNLGVTPALRQRGIGRALVEAMFRVGREMGCAGGWLGVDPDSDSALPFYRALGLPLRTASFAEFDLR